MGNWIDLRGPEQAVYLLDTRLVRFNAANGKKLLFTLALIGLLLLVGWFLRTVTRWVLRGHRNERTVFWTRQGIKLFTGVLLVVGVAAIWFDDPTTLTTGLALVTAGLAFALQKVITAIAGYFVIPRGKTFNVGDRIAMGGVRGDVIALGFTQTTIVEMGQPPAVQGADPAMWVRSRQVHRPGRHRQQRQDLRRAGLQLHARVPVPVGGDQPADSVRRRPREGRADPPGGGVPASCSLGRAGRGGD
jgi:hypothetical protein